MTQEVDSEQFYLVGKGLFDNAKSFYDAFNVNVAALGETGNMAGSDDAGTAWAQSYDARVAEVLGAVNDLTLAMENYGRVVIQVGYNHAVAEHNATPNNQGPLPELPIEPTSASAELTVPPSAGGPGEGLIDSAIGLVEQIGIPVPDGDTGKVDKAAGAWDRLATVHQTKTVVESLDVQARIFTDSKTPEDDYIAKDIGELRAAAQAVLDGCAELSQSCKDYKGHLDELREELKSLLHDLEVELAVTAAIAIATSFVSFGVGAVAGTAKAAHSITKFAKLIKDAIGTWKLSKKISDGVKKVHDIAGVRKNIERLKNLAKREKKEEPPPGAPRPNPELDYNTRPERLDHTFADKHRLDDVVKAAGSREQAMSDMLDALKGHVPQNGRFETVVTVHGEQVTVRGFVDNGVIKIGTAFIP